MDFTGWYLAPQTAEKISKLSTWLHEFIKQAFLGISSSTLLFSIFLSRSGGSLRRAFSRLCTYLVWKPSVWNGTSFLRNVQRLAALTKTSANTVVEILRKCTCAVHPRLLLSRRCRRNSSLVVKIPSAGPVPVLASTVELPYS